MTTHDLYMVDYPDGMIDFHLIQSDEAQECLSDLGPEVASGEIKNVKLIADNLDNDDIISLAKLLVDKIQYQAPK